MHEVAVLAYHGVLPFDLATPCEVFDRVTVPGIPKPYAVRVCGAARTVRAGLFDLRVPYGLADAARAQTVVLPGIADPAMPIPSEVVSAVRDATRRDVAPGSPPSAPAPSCWPPRACSTACAPRCTERLKKNHHLAGG